MTRYQRILLLLVVAVWVWSAIRPRYPHDWLLENTLVLLFIPALIFLGRYFRLSDFSYTLIAIFMALHMIGSHYTYAEVPFGYTLKTWFGADRNMYDRLVHFSFGLFFAYPIREIFLRLARVRGFWGYYLPFDVVLAFSGAFEIFEWRIAANVNPEAGMAYLGSQGDIWDAQKDMLMAGIGAALAMLTIAIINWRLNPGFLHDLRESFRVSKSDEPLGEVQLHHWLRHR